MDIKIVLKNNVRKVYINNQETNIYFRTPKVKFYNQYFDDRKHNSENIRFLKLIKKNIIKSRNYNHFDICSHLNFIPEKINIIDLREKNIKNILSYTDKYKNYSLYTIQSYKEIDNTDIEKYKNECKEIKFTQYCKLFNGKTLNKNIDIIVYKYGISVYSS